MIRILLILSILLIPFNVFAVPGEPLAPDVYDFSLLSPTNEQPDLSKNIDLKWEPVKDSIVSTYQLEIHKSSVSGNAWVPIQITPNICSSSVCSISTLSFSNTISIEYSNKYNWRVIAQDSSGDGIGNSQQWSFFTKQRPDSVSLPGDPSPIPDPLPGDPSPIPDPSPGPVNPPTFGIFQIQNPISSNSIPELITSLLNFVFGLSLVIAPLLVLYAGFLMITSAGDDTKLLRARKILMWTVIGFAIILISKGAPNVIKGIL